MLDYFHVSLPDGFPDHPHRGFETVTYMLKGTMNHEDFKGNKGSIGPGDIQWMTAGKGIVHAEVPAPGGPCIGFQLWINLPKSRKFIEPGYQDFKSSEIPEVKEDGLTVRLIAGESYGQSSKIKPNSIANFFDVHVAPGKVFEQSYEPFW